MFTVSGSINMATAQARLAEGSAAISAGETEFCLKELAGSDSAAIAVVLAWERRARETPGKVLRFVDVPEQLVTFAKLYGVAGFLSGFSDGSEPHS